MILLFSLTILILPISSAEAANNPLAGQVSFTFDDGRPGIYDHALPILTHYGIKGTFYALTGAIENQEPWVMSWRQVKTLKSLGWEIGSHSVTHPYLTTLTDEELDYELKEAKQILANQGIEAKSFAFPYGDYDQRVIDYTSRYYENSRRSWGNYGLNSFPYTNYEIVAREVSHTTPPEEVTQWIDDAMANNQWLVLLLHDIVLQNPSEYQYARDDLKLIASYIQDNNIPTTTVSQTLNYPLGPNLIENPKLIHLDEAGWALHWLRAETGDATVEPVEVERIFSSGNRLKMVGGPAQHSSYAKMIKLPDPEKQYLFSMFAEVKDHNAWGVPVYINEYDADGNWLAGKWLGGIHNDFFGWRSYFYQPSSTEVAKVWLEIFTEPNAELTFYGDNFYFGTFN